MALLSNPHAYLRTVGLPFLRAFGAAGLLVFLSMTAAQAQFAGPNSSRTVTNVEQAKTARLGRDVSLTGNIVERIWEDYYLFRDGTGQIRVEIERHLWRGRQVDANRKVRLLGDVSRGWRGRYISVDRLQVLD